MQIGGVKGHAGILEPLDACFDARSEAEVELDIRRTGLGIGIPEAAGLEERRGDRTGPEQDILNPGPKCPVEFCNTVISVIARAFSDDEKIQVILKVSTDTRQIVKHLDAHRPQMVGRSYAGLQKQLRRSDCAGGDQYFAFGAHDLKPREVTISTPVARAPSTIIRATCAPVRTVRFFRSLIGER